MADSEEMFCRLVSEFVKVCERRSLRVNVGKSKVMRCSRYVNMGRMHVRLNGEQLEEVDCSKYLGSQVTADGGTYNQLWYKSGGVTKSMLSNRGLGINTKKCLYDGVIVPTALYGAETWGMRSVERRRVDVLEMKCLRSMVGVTRMD